MNDYKTIMPYVTSLEHHGRAGEGLATQTEDGVSRRQGQLVRSSDRAMGFATYANASELGVNDLTGSTGSGLQKQTTLLTHRPN
jgi:hypothetical protein